MKEHFVPFRIALLNTFFAKGHRGTDISPAGMKQIGKLLKKTAKTLMQR